MGATAVVDHQHRQPRSVGGRPWNRVGPRYFDTIGSKAVRGRLLVETDTPDSKRVAVVNEAFRRRYLDKVEPLGQHVGVGDASHANDFEIVGVVEDVKYTRPTDPTRAMIFMPAFQSVEYATPGERSVQARSGLMRSIIVRTAAGSGTLEGQIRKALAEVDPNLAVTRVIPHVTQVALNFRIQRLWRRSLLCTACWRLVWRRWASTASPRTASFSARARSVFAWRSAPIARASCVRC
jgi:hypothetical protein